MSQSEDMMPAYLSGTGIDNNLWQEDTEQNDEDHTEQNEGDDTEQNEVDDTEQTLCSLAESPRHVLGSEESEEEYVAVQLERETEFMGVLMSSLGALPHDVTDGLHEELFEQLRVKLNEALLTAQEVETPDQFDETIVKILSSDEFVNSMVEVRDSILEYIQTHFDEGHVDDEGGTE